MKIKNQLNLRNQAIYFPKNNGNDNYLRLLTNHDKNILMNHSKILTNLTLMVAENDHLTPDGKGHYYPLIWHLSKTLVRFNIVTSVKRVN